MAVSVNRLLTDAKRLVTKLKDYDSKTDHLMARTQTLNKSVETMKDYHEEVTAMSGRGSGSAQRSAIIITIQRESKQLRKLETENRELKCALEDYQFVLELIMSKYRHQTNQLIKLERVESQGLNAQYTQSNETIVKLTNKICEMGSVMRRAIDVDEDSALKQEELIARLKLENKTLRELLRIAKNSGSLKTSSE